MPYAHKKNTTCGPSVKHYFWIHQWLGHRRLFKTSPNNPVLSLQCHIVWLAQSPQGGYPCPMPKKSKRGEQGELVKLLAPLQVIEPGGPLQDHRCPSVVSCHLFGAINPRKLSSCHHLFKILFMIISLPVVSPAILPCGPLQDHHRGVALCTPKSSWHSYVISALQESSLQESSAISHPGAAQVPLVLN